MTEQAQPAAQEEKKQLWTAKDVAAFLRVGESYIYELAKRGQIPCGKIGRLYRFEQAEIEAWWRVQRRR